MLAYIQDGAEQEWAEKLAAGLTSSRHRILQEKGWEHLTITDAPPHTYRTVHSDKEGVRLLVLHVLLRFQRP
jgi:hypothetical protein